jgi:protein ImuB
MHGGEGLMAEALVEAGRRAEWRVRVGVAGSKGVARIAARWLGAGGVVGVVVPGRDRESIAGLPIEALRPSPEASESFRRWGLGSVGALAALPAGEVALRLGANGVRLRALAAGKDEAPLVPTPFPDDPEERVDLDFPLVESEPLSFVLRGMLDRLAARLSERGTAFGAIGVRLRLEPDDPDERTLTLAAPTREVASVLSLLRVSIESSPPSAPVVGVEMRAVPGRVRPAQLSLFAPAGPSPERMAVTLARLAALVGADRVGVPVRDDGHRSAAPLPLRVVRPPLEAILERREGASTARPADRLFRLSTADARLSGPVVRASGPWRLRAGWWGDAPLERDYYDVEIRGGALLRLFHDVPIDSWFVDGVYD